MKKLLLAIALLFLMSIVSCSTDAPTGSVVKNDPVTLAWIGPLSGPVATLGLDNMHGVELAVKEINNLGGIKGRPLRLIVEDDAFETTKTLSAYENIVVRYQPVAVLSPTYNSVISLSDKAAQQKVVVIDSLDTSEEIAAAGDYVFGVGIYDEGIGYTISDFLTAKLRIKNVAILYNTEDPFMLLVKDAFTKRFEEEGEHVVFAEAYKGDTTDFRTSLLKVRENKAEALFVLGWDETGYLLRQAKELGINIPTLAIDTVTSQNVITNAKDGIEGVYFTSWEARTPPARDFTTKFTQTYGKAPDQPLFAATGYDSVFVIAKALETSEDLQSSLYTINLLEGVTGSLTMSPDGIVRSIKEEMFQYREGEFIMVN